MARQQQADGLGSEPILSVERSVQMLDLFTARRTSMSLADMHRELSWSRTTLHRYAVSLRRAGMLSYDSRAARYSLGPKIVLLGAAALSGLTLAQTAGPFLARLVAETHVTALLTVWDGTGPIVIRENDDTDQLVSLKVREGSRLPTYDSAAATVFLAFYEPAREQLKRERGRRHTPLSAREHELAAVRSSGIAYSETLTGLHSVAAAVFQAGEIVGAVSLLGTVTQLPLSGNTRETDELLTTCRDLSEALGGAA